MLIIAVLLSLTASATNQGFDTSVSKRAYPDYYAVYANGVRYEIQIGTLITYPGGSTGADVIVAQKALNSFNGYLYKQALSRYVNTNCGATDGIFGYATYSATCEYQRWEDLTVDGEIGDATWNAIASLSKHFYDNGYMLYIT